MVIFDPMNKNPVFIQLSKSMNLEEEKKIPEAYTEYLTCLNMITQKLQYDKIDQILPEDSTRYFKCAKECLFRIERLYNNLNDTKRQRSTSVYELENQRIKEILLSGEAKNVLHLQRKYAENLAIQKQEETYLKFMQEKKKIQYFLNFG